MELNPVVEGVEEFNDITKDPGFVMTVDGGAAEVVLPFGGSEWKEATGGTFKIF